MPTITLLSITARIEGETDAVTYGGQDVQAAADLLHSLEGEPLESLSVSLTGFDDSGQSHMLNRSAAAADMTIDVVPEDRMDQAMAPGALCDALRRDGLAWLEEMGA